MPTWVDLLQRIRWADENGVPQPFDAVRREYLSELHKTTGRDVILYSTAWTQPGGGSGLSINDRDIHAFMEVVHGLDGDRLDIVLHSPGGSPESAEQIIEYLRDKFDEIRIFVPQSAMSAATLMCCAADTIYMGRHSSLGPIDPQFLVQTPFGPRLTAAQAIIDQFQMAQAQVNSHTDLVPWQPILNQYPPGLLAECHEAMQLSRELAQKWAKKYMHSDKPDDAADQLSTAMSEYLSNRRQFKSHSRRITRNRAEENGFDVDSLEDDQQLQDAVLSVFHTAMHTHAGKPVMKIIENHNGRAVIQRAEGQITAGESHSLSNPSNSSSQNGNGEKADESTNNSEIDMAED
jgi:hypothetical protein